MALRIFPPPSPALPSFESLLVKGPYPSSAPLHLCLSHLARTERDRQCVILITPRKDLFTSSLRNFQDSWLASHAQTGEFAGLLFKTNIYYVPTSAHWSLLLSSFQLLRPSTSQSYSRVTLKNIPSMIILHQPSELFNGHSMANSEISQYLLLVMQAFSLASYFDDLASGEGKAAVVVFDSKLDELRMPIIRNEVSSLRFTPKDAHDDQIEFGENPHTKKESVGHLLEKYFDIIGRIEKVSSDTKSYQKYKLSEGRISRFCRITIMRTRPRPEEKAVVLEWAEMERLGRQNNEVIETDFLWGT